MAKLRVDATTWAKGKRLKPHYRLGDEQAEATLTTEGSVTTLRVKLFADGSGVIRVQRGDEHMIWQVTPEPHPLVAKDGPHVAVERA